MVEGVDEGNPGRNVELRDVLVRDPVEVFDHGAQAVPMSDDEGGLSAEQIGSDAVVPVREEAEHHVSQAFGRGKEVGGSPE